MEFLATVAKFAMWAGIAATVISVGGLIFTTIAVSNNASAPMAQALNNVNLFRNVILGGVLAGGVGATYTYWGEEVLSAVQVIVAALLYFTPLLVPTLGINADNKAGQAALGAIQTAGLIYGALALGVLLVDLAGRAKERLQQGSKADLLKYGKGVKEEKDRQNVFMGSCWQLPFCRKFVRERCPIYHSKRTCWREKVGCMCEEDVIRNAMENKPIPKDALLAANLIPKNYKLTMDQKKERCRSCVIYNEHQKHKYKLAMPLTFIGFLLVYVVGHSNLLDMIGGIVTKMDKMVGTITFRQSGSGSAFTSVGAFNEVLLVAFLVILFTYAMKILEYLIFKLKV